MSEQNNYIKELSHLNEENKVSSYEMVNGQTFWNKPTRDGITSDRLCNFEAHITSEQIHDDGLEQQVMYTIEGKLFDGRKLPPITIPSERFAAMNWVSAWGAKAIVGAGQGKKDHLRVAIQEYSSNLESKHVYTHVGWTRIEGKYHFLHAAGGIGENGNNTSIEVNPGEGRLKEFIFPDPAAGQPLIDAVRASMKLLELGPPRLMYPLFAAIYRAPLGEMALIDFALFFVGASGNFKSEITAMAQSHFGAGFHSRNLPENWTSTDNAMERNAFLGKDVIFTIDDFAPTGSGNDIMRLHQKADRVIRAQGNGSGRSRLTKDLTPRPPNHPRGLIISSGEDNPKGQSLNARMLSLEVSPGDIDPSILGKLQESGAKGELVQAMSSYVKWLASRVEKLKQDLPNRQRALRTTAAAASMHRRTPDIVASLSLGLSVFGAFAEEMGVLSEEDHSKFLSTGWSAILDSANAQASHQASEDPVTKFRDLLAGAITSGRAHLASPENGNQPKETPRAWGWKDVGDICNENWRAQGEKIGWVSEEELLLEPNATFAAIQKFARDQGEAFPLSRRTLWKRLAEKDLILTQDGRNQVKRTAEGNRRSVIAFPGKNFVYPPGKTVAIGTIGTEGPFYAQDVPKKCPSFPLADEKVGQKTGTFQAQEVVKDPIVPIVPVSTGDTPSYENQIGI